MQQKAKYCIEKELFCDFFWGWVAISRYRSFKVTMGMLCFVKILKFLKFFNFLILITFAARVTFL